MSKVTLGNYLLFSLMVCVCVCEEVVRESVRPQPPGLLFVLLIFTINVYGVMPRSNCPHRPSETTRCPTSMQSQRVFIPAQAQTPKSLSTLKTVEGPVLVQTLPIYHDSRVSNFPTWQLHGQLTFAWFSSIS